jgi:hypothetical protein
MAPTPVRGAHAGPRTSRRAHERRSHAIAGARESRRGGDTCSSRPARLDVPFPQPRAVRRCDAPLRHHALRPWHRAERRHQRPTPGAGPRRTIAEEGSVGPAAGRHRARITPRPRSNSSGPLLDAAEVHQRGERFPPAEKGHHARPVTALAAGCARGSDMPRRCINAGNGSRPRKKDINAWWRRRGTASPRHRTTAGPHHRSARSGDATRALGPTPAPGAAASRPPPPPPLLRTYSPDSSRSAPGVARRARRPRTAAP